MPSMMLVTCNKRELEKIVDEFADWKDEGLAVKLYGVTAKARDGFVLLEWSKPIPARFAAKLKQDTDMLDYLIYDAPGPQAGPASSS